MPMFEPKFNFFKSNNTVYGLASWDSYDLKIFSDILILYEKECVKVCDNLKSWIPSHRRFHRYLKLQKRTYIAKVMRILSFSQKYIFHTHKIVARRRIAIWGLRSARIKKLKKTDPHYFSKKIRVCFLQLFDPRHGLVSNCNSSLPNYFTHNFFMILAP